MGKLAGSVLILAGIAVAAYTLASSPQRDAVPQVATAESGGAPVIGPQTEAPPGAGAAPVPSGAGGGAAEPPRAMAALPESQATAAASPATASPPPAGPERLAGAPAAPVPVSEAAPRLPVGDPKVGPPLNRPALVREIQRHLKRLGCYRGDLSGAWTPAVRQAMQAFTDRVNASLPTDQPDPVLLAMVQGHEPGVCSAACPAGQARAGSGRCVPSALVAGADKEPTPKAQARTDGRKAARMAASAPARSAPAAMVDLQAPAEGRMSLAGPPAAEARQGRTARVAPARATTAKPATSYRAASVRTRGRYRTTQRPADSGLSGWFFGF